MIVEEPSPYGISSGRREIRDAIETVRDSWEQGEFIEFIGSIEFMEFIESGDS